MNRTKIQIFTDNGLLHCFIALKRKECHHLNDKPKAKHTTNRSYATQEYVGGTTRCELADIEKGKALLLLF